MEMKIIHPKSKEVCGRMFKCTTGNIIYKFSAFHIDPTPDCSSESLGIWFVFKNLKFTTKLKSSRKKFLGLIMVIRCHSVDIQILTHRFK